MFNLFKTYNKVKDVFVRPKIKFRIGLWKKMCGLPMWRRGKIIRIAKPHQYHIPKDFVYIKQYNAGDTMKDGTIINYNRYVRIKHKLPNGVKGCVWNHNIRKKLRRCGLDWIKPYYVLPHWLAFHIFDLDVISKWKEDEIVYEFSPQFTIVFFGIAFHVTLQVPLEDEYDCEEHYWDSLLCFLYQKECNQNITDTLNFCGKWNSYKADEEDMTYFQLRKSHIKPEYHEEYDMAVLNYNDNKKVEKCCF